jgi:hypothetical protein
LYLAFNSNISFIVPKSYKPIMGDEEISENEEEKSLKDVVNGMMKEKHVKNYV